MAMDESAKGKTVLPAHVKVLHIDVGVTLRLALAPQKQRVLGIELCVGGESERMEESSDVRTFALATALPFALPRRPTPPHLFRCLHPPLLCLTIFGDVLDLKAKDEHPSEAKDHLEVMVNNLCSAAQKSSAQCGMWWRVCAHERM